MAGSPRHYGVAPARPGKSFDPAREGRWAVGNPLRSQAPHKSLVGGLKSNAKPIFPRYTALAPADSGGVAKRESSKPRRIAVN